MAMLRHLCACTKNVLSRNGTNSLVNSFPQRQPMSCSKW